MNYWLMKSEPESYSIEDLLRDKTTTWNSIRNYRARNIMRDEMKSGDLFLFYHSGDQKGVVGTGKILEPNLPDITALDKNDDYYDPKASKEKNPWIAPKVAFVGKFKRLVTLGQIKANKRLKDMILLKIPRLSVQPVTKEEFEMIEKLGGE
ncbi:MAG: EVE domain-containing protein [Candidatus Doudnabacteria bacterium]